MLAVVTKSMLTPNPSCIHFRFTLCICTRCISASITERPPRRFASFCQPSSSLYFLQAFSLCIDVLQPFRFLFCCFSLLLNSSGKPFFPCSILLRQCTVFPETRIHCKLLVATGEVDGNHMTFRAFCEL